jgi:predicted RNA binding protein YcfA (HicA-like mRNA interferase family)
MCESDDLAHLMQSNIPMAERRRRRLLQKLLSGSKNIRFAEAVTCAEAFGFRLSRINGSHHIYIHTDIPELVNLQNVNGQAKPYQVKQLLRLIERYNLHLEERP